MLTKNLLNYYSLKITKVIVSKNESARTKKTHVFPSDINVFDWND